MKNTCKLIVLDNFSRIRLEILKKFKIVLSGRCSKKIMRG